MFETTTLLRATQMIEMKKINGRVRTALKSQAEFMRITQ